MPWHAQVDFDVILQSICCSPFYLGQLTCLCEHAHVCACTCAYIRMHVRVCVCVCARERVHECECVHTLCVLPLKAIHLAF